MAKKAAKKKTPRISPVIKKETIDVTQIDDLDINDCFISNGGNLFMLVDTDPIGVNLETGQTDDFSCGDIVIPVEIKITWKKNKTRGIISPCNYKIK